MSIAHEPGTTRIYTDETPRRHAPVTETGILGWLRHNLFSTPLDILLTLVSAYAIYIVISGTLTWVIRDANWFAITRNLPLFMLGPLQADAPAVTSVQLMTLVLAFAVGLSLAAWSYVGLRGWIMTALVIAICLFLPGIIAQTFSLPASINAVGNVGIVSGSLTETPNTEFAFVGKAGEVFSASLAAEDTGDDYAVAKIAAFTDRATDALVNAARNRTAALARIEEINARLEDPNITDTEQGILISEHGALLVQSEKSPSEQYTLNSAPVTIRLLSGDLETVLATGVLASASDRVEFTLPETGWYVLEKSVEADGTISIVQLNSVFPHMERQSTRPMRDSNGEIVLGVNGLPRQQTVTQYQRLIDDTLITTVAPQREGKDIQRYLVIDNQFRGERTLGEFLVLHLGPFVERLSRAFVPCLILVFIGYHFTRVLDLAGNSLRAMISHREFDRLSTSSVTPSQYGHADQAKSNQIAQFFGSISRFVQGFVRNWWRHILLFVVLGLVFHLLAGLDTATTLAAAAFFTVIIVISVQMLMPVANIKWSRRVVNWVWFIMPFIIFALVAGTDLGRWGGLFLTFMLTAVGIVASFPIGVLLALGRRADSMPVIKYLCIAFIELVRGVPLVTVLFLAALALPLVSPGLSSVPQAVRAMVAITLFSAAYLAENVRGGLQSIPHGQAEAARALGMNPIQVTMHITLPQALRAVIPALVGQCIALFKDTSLVAIVGLLDLTKNADSVVAQAEYIGLRREVYIFISVVYFVFSYAMAYVSRKLEQSGSGSARQTKL